MKISVFKASADGEQINFEVNVPSEIHKLALQGQMAPLDNYLAPVFHVADQRLLEMNQRVQSAKYVMDHFDPETRMKMLQILEIIHGNVPTPQIKALVEGLVRERQERQAASPPAPSAMEIAEAVGLAGGVEITP